MNPEDPGRIPIRRALLSVFDTTGVDRLALALERHKVELWATEGTRRALHEAGVVTHAAEELTGIGSWFGGRIKTLHPGILGGILAPRDAAGLRELEEHHLKPIDLVAVNFYPFERRFAEGPTTPELVESIDIGGVTLVRAAAKNHASVAILSSPRQYDPVVRELDGNEGALSAARRRELAGEAFARVQAYDRVIAAALQPRSLEETAFPERLEFGRDSMVLRYGENPHQRAQPYAVQGPAGVLFDPIPIERLQGEALSFTNLLDLDTAVAIVSEFPDPSAAVVKHATPTGVATGPTLREAIEAALATDPVARYGCVLAVNRGLVARDSEPLHGVFVDLLAAPDVDPAEREALSHRKKLKLVRCSPPGSSTPRWEAKSALGRLLVQEADRRELVPGDFRLVTKRSASPEQVAALEFAWRVVRHAKSNAVVLAQGTRTVGLGSGQPTRVKAVELGCEVAGDRAKGAVLASDAFFPFPDGVEVAGAAGVAAILQPGGSVRDAEVIAAADRHGIAMYLTGWRVFRH